MARRFASTVIDGKIAQPGLPLDARRSSTAPLPPPLRPPAPARLRDADRVLRQPVRQVDRDDRQQDHHQADHVHDRQLVRARVVGEDPDRQGLLLADRERRDDDLVEREREGEQRARHEGGPQRREGHEPEGLPAVGAQVHARPPRARCPLRRSRATALLKTTTMQNVAWPTITVNSVRSTPAPA